MVIFMAWRRQIKDEEEDVRKKNDVRKGRITGNVGWEEQGYQFSFEKDDEPWDENFPRKFHLKAKDGYCIRRHSDSLCRERRKIKRNIETLLEDRKDMYIREVKICIYIFFMSYATHTFVTGVIPMEVFPKNEAKGNISWKTFLFRKNVEGLFHVDTMLTVPWNCPKRMFRRE